jgi:LysM repeat protein
VPVGHTLLVPSQRPTPEGAATLTQAAFTQPVITTVPQGRTFYYRVSRGDTLEGIAARYAVSAQDLRRWNNLGQKNIQAGQSLRITSDLAPNAASAKRATGGKSRATTVKTRAPNGKPKAAACCAKTGAVTGKTPLKTTATGR